MGAPLGAARAAGEAPGGEGGVVCGGALAVESVVALSADTEVVAVAVVLAVGAAVAVGDAVGIAAGAELFVSDKSPTPATSAITTATARTTVVRRRGLTAGRSSRSAASGAGGGHSTAVTFAASTGARSPPIE